MKTRYNHRITWIEGKPHVQRCPVEIVLYSSFDGHRTRPGNYRQDGEILRPATAEDMAAMYDGRLSYDPATDPSSLAWAAHVQAGGD